jgi:hypothetical protein
MKSIIALLFLSIYFLAGCATTPVTTAEAKVVPASRILASEYLVRQPGSCLVIIKRDAGIGGSACSSRVSVDGHPVADVASGEKISLYVSAGDHIIGSDPNGICGGGLSEVSIAARPDKPATLRIRYGSNGDYTIQPTAM